MASRCGICFFSLYLTAAIALSTSSCVKDDPQNTPIQKEDFPSNHFEGELLAEPVITDQGYYLLARIDGEPWLCHMPPPARNFQREVALSELDITGDLHDLDQFNLQLLSDNTFFVSYLGLSEQQNVRDYIGLSRLGLSEGIVDLDTLGRPNVFNFPGRIMATFMDPFELTTYIIYQSREINLNNYPREQWDDIENQIENIFVTSYDNVTDSLAEFNNISVPGLSRQRSLVIDPAGDASLLAASSGGNLQEEQLPATIREFDVTLGAAAFFAPVETRLREDLNISIDYIAKTTDPNRIFTGRPATDGYLVYGQDRDQGRSYIALIEPQAQDTLWSFSNFANPTYITDFAIVNGHYVAIGYESIANANYGNWPEVYENPSGGGVVYGLDAGGALLYRGSTGDFSETGQSVIEFDEDGTLERFQLINTINETYPAKLYADSQHLYLAGATRTNQVYNDIGVILLPYALFSDTSSTD